MAIGDADEPMNGLLADYGIMCLRRLKILTQEIKKQEIWLMK
jgi:hypothetical protein